MVSNYFFVVLLIIIIGSLQATSAINDESEQNISLYSESEQNDVSSGDKKPDSENINEIDNISNDVETSEISNRQFDPADLIWERRQYEQEPQNGYTYGTSGNDEYSTVDYYNVNERPDKIVIGEEDSQLNEFGIGPRNADNFALNFHNFIKTMLENEESENLEPRSHSRKSHHPGFACNVLTIINTGTITNSSASINLEGHNFIVNNITVKEGIHLANANLTATQKADIIVDLVSFKKKRDLKILGKKGKKKLVRTIINNLAKGTVLIINTGTINDLYLDLPGSCECPQPRPTTQRERENNSADISTGNDYEIAANESDNSESIDIEPLSSEGRATNEASESVEMETNPARTKRDVEAQGDVPLFGSVNLKYENEAYLKSLFDYLQSFLRVGSTTGKFSEPHPQREHYEEFYEYPYEINTKL